ncbi:hypothetical protein F5Y13DRAFT_115393 [Hypoxylon sp. FL1857]|nr:hypothetical protein F5Y13DRAFT_115393 [Hypoxylon sp. FL1857]
MKTPVAPFKFLKHLIYILLCVAIALRVPGLCALVWYTRRHKPRPHVLVQVKARKTEESQYNQLPSKYTHNSYTTGTVEYTTSWKPLASMRRPGSPVYPSDLH